MELTIGIVLIIPIAGGYISLSTRLCGVRLPNRTCLSVSGSGKSRCRMNYCYKSVVSARSTTQVSQSRRKPTYKATRHPSSFHNQGSRNYPSYTRQATKTDTNTHNTHEHKTPTQENTHKTKSDSHIPSSLNSAPAAS
jgi:hypothetical protein